MVKNVKKFETRDKVDAENDFGYGACIDTNRTFPRARNEHYKQQA